MTSFIAIIKTLIALLPILRDLVLASEALFPAQGSGVQKLELVRKLLQSAYDTAHTVETPFDAVWPTVQNLIGFVVPIFTKSSPPVTTSVSASEKSITTQAAALPVNAPVVQLASDA